MNSSFLTILCTGYVVLCNRPDERIRARSGGQKKNRRVFTENGALFIFNDKAFKSCVMNAAKQRGTTQGRIMDELSDTLGVTKDAVNNWLYGRNGVSDPEMIRKAAACLQVDWTLLVRKMDGGITMFHLTDRQKDAAKRIYNILMLFMSA